MKRLLAFAIVFSVSALGVRADEKPYSVAVLPTWNNHGHNVQWNYIFKEAGWAYTNIMENKSSMDWLAGNLDKYDLLFAPQLFGYRKAPYDKPIPFDMKAYAPAIRDWIKKGGCLFLIDANYPEPCFGLTWFKDMDPAMEVSAGKVKCNGFGPAVGVEPADPILFFPNKAEYGFGWNHMTVPDQEKTAWTILSRCQHGEPTLMIRRWGKGIVLISTNSIYIKQFMQNLKANQSFLDMGLAILSAKSPMPLPGPNRFEVQCSNSSDKDIAGVLTLRITPVEQDEKGKIVKEGKSSEYSSKSVVKANSKGVFSLDCVVKERGRVRAELIIDVNGKSGSCYKRICTLPEFFKLEGTRYRNLLSKSRRFDDVKFKTVLYPIDASTNISYIADVQIVNSKGSTIGKSTAPITRGNSYVSIRIPRTLPVGEYIAKGSLKVGGSDKVAVESECAFEILDDAPGGAYYDEDMTLLVDGKPYLPLGIYHVYGNGNNAWNEIADIGFNVFNIFSYRGTDSLRALRKLNVKTLWEQLPHRSPWACKAQGTELSSNPASLLWYTVDEPSEAMFDFVKSLDAAWNEIDKHHPTFLVSYQPHHFSRNAQISDILAPDNYPYSESKGEDSYISSVSKFVDRAIAATDGNGPVIFVPQAFGFEPPHIWRNMSLQALCHGAKGLIWYAWRENETVGLKYNMKLRAECERLIAQLKALAPAILNAENPPRLFVMNDNTLHGMVMTDPETKAKYMILVNSSKQPVKQDLAIEELDKAQTEIKGAFGYAPLKCADGTIKLKFKGFESGIYVLSGEAPVAEMLNRKYLGRRLPKRASGKTLRVAADATYTNLQAAVDAAKDGDIIKVAEGVYGPVVCDNKLLDIIAEGDVSKTIITAGGKARTLTLSLKPHGAMDDQRNVLLRGFTITGGNSTLDKFRSEMGGGVLGGTLEQCEVKNNTSRYGGGCAYTTLNDCRVTGNQALLSGGGLAMCDAAFILLSNNRAKYDGGGAHFSDISRSTLRSNTAERDGGASHFGSLTSCQVISNTAGRDGGGATRSKAQSVYFAGNVAGRDGGAVCAGVTSHGTIVGNRAARFGGGAVGTPHGGWGVSFGMNSSVFGANVEGTDRTPSVSTNMGFSTTFIDVDLKIRGCKTFDTNKVVRARDWSLTRESDLINVSPNFFKEGDVDVLGAPRIRGAAADAGAFEFPVEETTFSADFSKPLPFYGGMTDDYRIFLGGDTIKTLKSHMADGALSFNGDFRLRLGSFEQAVADANMFSRRNVKVSFSTKEAKAGKVFSVGDSVWAEVDAETGRLKMYFVKGRISKDQLNAAVFESAKAVTDGKIHSVEFSTGKFDGLANIATVKVDGRAMKQIAELKFTKDEPFVLPMTILLGGTSNANSFIGKIHSFEFKASNR